MKPNALDRLIEKNEQQSKIRKTESRGAVKYGLLGYILYIVAVAVGFGLAQDSVRFFGYDLWGMAKIIWLIGISFLTLIGLISIFVSISYLIAIKWLWPYRKKIWAAKKWRPIHIILMLIRVFIPFFLIYLIGIYTQYMRNTGNDISSYVASWHKLPHALTFFIASILMTCMVILIILTVFHHTKLLYRLLTSEEAKIQHFSHQPKNDDWI